MDNNIQEQIKQHFRDNVEVISMEEKPMIEMKIQYKKIKRGYLEKTERVLFISPDADIKKIYELIKEILPNGV